MKRSLLFAFLILGFCAAVILGLFGEDIEVNWEILIHDCVMTALFLEETHPISTKSLL